MLTRASQKKKDMLYSDIHSFAGMNVCVGPWTYDLVILMFISRIIRLGRQGFSIYVNI